MKQDVKVEALAHKHDLLMCEESNAWLLLYPLQKDT